jgi:hypothetical protein
MMRKAVALAVLVLLWSLLLLSGCDGAQMGLTLPMWTGSNQLSPAF